MKMGVNFRMLMHIMRLPVEGILVCMQEGSTDTSRCPQDLDRNTFLRSHGSKCYYFERSETNWLSAQAGCQRSGGDLITITRQDIQLFVEGVLRELWTKNGMWIGAHDRHDEMDWYWVNGAKARHGGNYENWDAGRPSCFLPKFMCHEDCGVLRIDEGYTWYDYLCYSDLYEYGFACEYDMIPLPRTTTAPTTTTATTTTAATTTPISSEATTPPISQSTGTTTLPMVVVKTSDGEHSALHSDDFTVDNSSLIQDNVVVTITAPVQNGEVGRHVMSSEQGGMATGSLVGIIVSCIFVFLAGLAVGILICRRRRANNTLHSAAPQSDTRVKDTNLTLALSQHKEDRTADCLGYTTQIQWYADIDALGAGSMILKWAGLKL